MFRIKLFRPDDHMNNRLRLRIDIGNLEAEIEFGILITMWRYCKLCKGILQPDGCDNPRCPNYETHTKKHTRSISIPTPEADEIVTARRLGRMSRLAAVRRLPAAGKDGQRHE